MGDHFELTVACRHHGGVCDAKPSDCWSPLITRIWNLEPVHRLSYWSSGEDIGTCRMPACPTQIQGFHRKRCSLCLQRMPGWYAWFYYLNPFAYSLEGIVLSQLGDVDTLVALPDGGSISVKEALAVTFGYHYSFLGYIVLIMIGFSLCFAVTGLICLHKLKFQSR